MVNITNFQDSDDPFAFIRKLFINFGNNKILRCVNAFVIIFHLMIVSLEIYFINDNFSVELITQYVPMMTVLFCFLVVMIAVTLIETNVQKTVHSMDKSFWSIDSAGPDVRLSILKKSAGIKLYFYVVCVFTIISFVCTSPLCGTRKEWILAEIAIEQYLGTWSTVVNYVYCWSIALMAFAVFRPCALFLYAVAEISLQIHLINQRILQVCVDQIDFDRLKIGQKIIYQNNVFKTLCSCTQHHVTITRAFNNLHDFLKPMMAIFSLVGALLVISLSFLILYAFEEMSTLLKLRLSVATVANGVVVYTYCQTGQTIVDETGSVLDTLSQCSWYNWDYKNKQILLIFMANSLKPCTFTFAGFQVDKRLAVSIFRTGYTYALILYNLKKN